MARRLAGNVALRNPATGIVEVFTAGRSVPEWAESRIRNPKAWETDPNPEPVESPTSPPPKAGRGSSLEAWSRYAATRGIEVTEDMKRDDIIAALVAAGVPTE